MEIESLCPVTVQALLSFLGYHNNPGHLINLPACCHAKIQFIRLTAAKSRLFYCISNDIIFKTPSLPVHISIFPRTLPLPPDTTNKMDYLEFPKYLILSHHTWGPHGVHMGTKQRWKATAKPLPHLKEVWPSPHKWTAQKWTTSSATPPTAPVPLYGMVNPQNPPLDRCLSPWLLIYFWPLDLKICPRHSVGLLGSWLSWG